MTLPFFSDQEWINKLTVMISGELSGMFGDGSILMPEPPERLERRYSFMFRYRVTLPDETSRTILVKIPRESWMETMNEAITSDGITEFTQREFDALSSISNTVNNADVPGLTAIRPLACFRDLGALVMEEFPLVMLKKFLSSPMLYIGFDGGKFENHVVMAGVWLSLMHDKLGKGDSVKLASLKLLDQFDEDSSWIREHGGKIDKLLRDRFVRSLDQLQNEDVALSSIHNDFQLGNVFVLLDGRVGALDPNWVENKPVFEDISSLLIDPLTRKANVATFGMLFRIGLFKKYYDAFLRGYYSMQDGFPDRLISLFCALDVLAKWRTNEEMLEEFDEQSALLRKTAAIPVRYVFPKLLSYFLDKAVT